jgi:hypothetical protein
VTNEHLAQAFEMCVVREWNLSYSCLTGYAARSKLRGLRESDPEFWDELTSKKCEGIPPEDVPQPEDIAPAQDVDSGIDDSDVPVQSLVNNILHKKMSKGYTILPDGGIEANAEAERFSDVDEVAVDDGTVDKELGRGKRKRKPNTRYTSFWRHNDDSDSEVDG